MNDERLLELAMLTPRGKHLRAEIEDEHRGMRPEDIERISVDALANNLATACILYFQMSLSTAARVSSILDGDAFVVSALLLHALRDPAIRSRQSPDRIACLDALEELLLRVGAKAGRLRHTVKRELMAAGFLAVALGNAQSGHALHRGLVAGVFLCDELYAPVCASTTLRAVVDEVQRRLAESS